MQSEVMFAGFGGQGILFSAKILAEAALEQGYEVVWIPSYGPEMRGGTAYCMVVVSDKPIASPIVGNPLHLVAMNRPSLEKFAPAVKPGGVIIINSSLIKIDSGRKDVDEIKVPASDVAKDIGSIKAANIVALGAFAARSRMVDFEILKNCVRAEFSGKEKLIPLNMQALESGRLAALNQ